MPTDYSTDVVKNSWTVVASATALLATATKAAEGSATGPGRRHHVITQVDVSYSTSTQSGLFEVKYGTTVKGSKYCHGQGALGYGVLGLQNPNSNEAVSVELAAGAGGVVGIITMTGYTTGPNE